ncbi:MAG TPA: DMT family transporter, partial [Steroidobacteraceae bacterium]|nr:DMT family transporter [Steroidobacteraceae bacterium]
ALLQIHLCVFLWGFTAIFGRLISLPAFEIVWWRMLLVAVCLACVPRVWRALRSMPWRLIAVFAAIGGLLAMHWLTFYQSIKLANASVAATCMAIAPAVTAMVEPLLTRTRFEPRNLLLAALVVPGVALVVGGMPSDMHLGFWLGVLSAVLIAMVNSLNKRYLGTQHVLAVTGLEVAGGLLVLMLVLPLFAANGVAGLVPGRQDFLLLMTLAIVCTLLPFALSLVALRHLSAFTAQLAVNLEPIYTVVIAAVFLNEAQQLQSRFYLGALIVIATMLVHSRWFASKQLPPGTDPMGMPRRPPD